MLTFLNEQRLFYLSLLLSLLAHLVTLVFLSATKVKIKRPFKQMEVIYQELKVPAAKKKEPKYKELKINTQTHPTKATKILSHQPSQSSFPKGSIKDISKIGQDIKLEKKIIPTFASKDIEHKITIPLLESDKMTNPQYLSYNDSIRQKIKQRAFYYVNDTDFKPGQVYLTFVLLSNGALKQVKIIDAKTNADDYLRQTGLRSIEESTPFAPFPKDLNFPELTFNVIISFEIKK